MWNPETNIRGPQGIQGEPGEVEEAPEDGLAYVRQDGEWVEIDLGSASVVLSDIPPVDPTHGTVWVETDTGLMYVFYVDGTSSQWFAVSGATSGGPMGPPGMSSSAFQYRFDSVTAANDPGTGKFRFNNAVTASVTEIYVDRLTSDGQDPTALFKLSTYDDKLLIQETDFSYNYIVFNMTGAAVEMPDWFKIPVAFVQQVGPNLANNTRCTFLVRTQGETGPQGPPGVDGIDGADSTVPGPAMPIYISDTPPPTPLDNTLWYESDTGLLFLRYRDGDSVQWIALPGGYMDAVRYSAQALTEGQKIQARANIEAAKASVIDTVWTALAFQNGWTNYSAPYGPAGFRKIGNGIVVLKGLIQGGTANPMFTLPVGYRPGYQMLVNVQTSPNVACRLDITTDGAVNHTGGNNGWISLNSTMFLAEN